MNIQERTWNIQACSALTKEGKLPKMLIVCRSSGRHGVVGEDDFSQ
jgi:hypothetical protein